MLYCQIYWGDTNKHSMARLLKNAEPVLCWQDGLWGDAGFYCCPPWAMSPGAVPGDGMSTDSQYSTFFLISQITLGCPCRTWICSETVDSKSILLIVQKVLQLHEGSFCILKWFRTPKISAEQL